MYSLIYTKEALKQLKKLDKSVRNRIILVLERCRIRPHHYIKKLVGNPYFRLRVGDFRIILSVKKSELITYILEVGNRRNIYKK